jgi:hypothetical protein
MCGQNIIPRKPTDPLGYCAGRVAQASILRIRCGCLTEYLRARQTLMMSATSPEWVAAFETLFLDPLPTAPSISGAVAELTALSVVEFTVVAMTTLTDSGPEPRRTSVCVKRRTLRKNVDSTPCTAWHFDVYVDSGRAAKRLDMWLCTDGLWATSFGALRATPFRMTELERNELTDTHRVGLIEGRARRVQTWLDKPHGVLNPGVT